MFTRPIALACLALLPLFAAAAPSTLSVRVVDAQTGNVVPNARVILNHGPTADPVSAEMEQKNRQFQPKVLLVSKDSEVNFPNRDTTQHHVYSFSPTKSFNLELFADRPDAPVVFDKTGVVEVGCNIHDNMQGFILVTDSSLTAQTNASGGASIALPESIAGSDLSVSLWHPRLTDATRTVDVTVSLPADDPVELAVELSPEREKVGRLDGLQKRFQDL